jgi:hypothetical protein
VTISLKKRGILSDGLSEQLIALRCCGALLHSCCDRILAIKRQQESCTSLCTSHQRVVSRSAGMGQPQTETVLKLRVVRLSETSSVAPHCTRAGCVLEIFNIRITRRRLTASKSVTAAALNIEPYCNIYCLFSLSLRFWRVQYMGAMN